MFSTEELLQCCEADWFRTGYQQLERNLLLNRLGMAADPLSGEQRSRLARFSQAVIAGAAEWGDPTDLSARQLCQLAADIEASLATDGQGTEARRHLALLKAVVLYELAGIPAASASHAARNGLDKRFQAFFTRAPDSVWGRLARTPAEAASRGTAMTPSADMPASIRIEHGLGDVVQEAGYELQGGQHAGIFDAIGALAQIAADYSLDVTGDDVLALKRLLEMRQQRGSLPLLQEASHLTEKELRALALPVELWPAQVKALEKGLLNQSVGSFGLAAPTGTGKTALAQVVIADALAAQPGRKVVYVCPSRALVHQVSRDLGAALQPLGLRVLEAGAHLISHEHIPLNADDADVLVFTPERADLLLRVDPDFLSEICLVIVDEAHHIEQGPRGVLLEFYLWRLRRLIPTDARIVQLSAVTPNINELVDWLANDKPAVPLRLDWRTNRLRVGLLERTSRGAANLVFSDGMPYTLLSDGALPAGQKEGLATLANRLSKNGVVLVLCMSPATAEDVARLVSEDREGPPEDVGPPDEVNNRLDAWIERELYPESELRSFLKKGVLFHHAQLPPRVRLGIEDAISKRKANVICATTTLAEGVNFPFSTVLIESLVGARYELSPRELWNIAGRAGRFGVDTEGHCILYRPSTWADRLKEYKLEDYLKSSLADIPPVRSALGWGLGQLHELVSSGSIDQNVLGEISLNNIKVDGKNTREAKQVRALINIMRVSYAHANSVGSTHLSRDDAPEFDSELLAAKQMSPELMSFAKGIAQQQRYVVRSATEGNADFVAIAAKVGWSLEAQHKLYAWLQTRENWQLEQFGNIVLGGYVRNFNHLSYLIGPVSKNLIAFEGEALGGASSYLAEKWIRGIPLSHFQEERGASFGLMISRIYGRMQYLLPWGLFGMHELLMFEANRRGILVGDGVNALSVLAAEGVPNFDALQLVLGLGIERADATRLSQKYRGDRNRVDIVEWFSGLRWGTVEQIVAGPERRRLDPTLRTLFESLQAERGATE